MKFAIVLFPLDVAVRRIQLDREEWGKAMRALRRWLFFWRTVPQSARSDVSLAALLNRRDEVRARKAEMRPTEIPPDPNLFRPKTPPKVESAPESIPAEGLNENGADEVKKTEEPQNTTSRLLEAKRRARKNLE